MAKGREHEHEHEHQCPCCGRRYECECQDRYKILARCLDCIEHQKECWQPRYQAGGER